jgi:hypothetical protein
MVVSFLYTTFLLFLLLVVVEWLSGVFLVVGLLSKFDLLMKVENFGVEMVVGWGISSRLFSWEKVETVELMSGVGPYLNILKSNSLVMISLQKSL